MAARPAEHFIQRFSASMIPIGDTVESYLRRRLSLGIACKDCPRMVEWTPPMLLEKFGNRLDLPIGEIHARLACKGEGGCGSKDMAVFALPHLEPWTWPPRSG